MIVNLTSVRSSEIMNEHLIVDFMHDLVLKAFRFDQAPTEVSIYNQCLEVVKIAQKSKCKQALVGGPLFMVPQIESELLDLNIEPIYSYIAKNPNGKEFKGIVRPFKSQFEGNK